MLAIRQTTAVLDRIIGSAKSEAHLRKFRILLGEWFSTWSWLQNWCFMNCGGVGSNSMGAELTCRWQGARCTPLDDWQLHTRPLLSTDALRAFGTKDIQLSTEKKKSHFYNLIPQSYLDLSRWITQNQVKVAINKYM